MKKKFAGKRRDFYIRCSKTPVNDQKSKQDKNLQNPLRTRTKNKRGAQNTPCAKIPSTNLPPQAFVAAILKLKERAGIIFRNFEKSNDGNPRRR